VTSIAVDEINPQIAIGLSNGTVIHIKGDITRDRFLKQRVIHEHEQNVPITGIAFRQWAGDTVLYITTPNSVILWNGKEKDHLDNIGAGPNCVVATEPDNNVMIGRTEGIYYYTPEGRGPCFAFQGTLAFSNHPVYLANEWSRRQDIYYVVSRIPCRSFAFARKLCAERI